MRRLLVLIVVTSAMVAVPAGSAGAAHSGRGLPGNSISEIDLNNDGTIDSVSTSTNTYDNRGLLTESVEEFVFPAAGIDQVVTTTYIF